MELFTPMPYEAANSLGIALVVASPTPLILLDNDFNVKAASGSFCRAFGLDPGRVIGVPIFDLGDGEWNLPKLRSLLETIGRTHATIDAYELDFNRHGDGARCLILNAHQLDYQDADQLRIVLAITDVTDIRSTERALNDVARRNEALLEELQHRVANSLQIIASVIMQSARSVQSEEARLHLHDAHHRVMSVAALQKQLARTHAGNVILRPYFEGLCATIGASMIADPAALKLVATIDDSSASPDAAVSLGLIVTELVINSLKHAFPGKTKLGAITVRYQSHHAAWSLTVVDTGIGMPADPASIKPGLGTGIVEALAGQLSAQVHISSANPGTSVAITSAGPIDRLAA